MNSVKPPHLELSQVPIKNLINQPNSEVAIPLAEFAIGHPDNIWQGCEIIQAIRKIPPSHQKETALKILSNHPVKVISEAAKKTTIDSQTFPQLIDLSSLNTQHPAIIKNIIIGTYGEGLIKRLKSMGVAPQKPIMVLRKSCFGGPIHVRVGVNTELAIRREEAKIILVEPII